MRELIDTALARATSTQFELAYPQAREFFDLKKRYDPSGVFENTFFLNYSQPLMQ